MFTAISGIPPKHTNREGRRKNKRKEVAGPIEHPGDAKTQGSDRTSGRTHHSLLKSSEKRGVRESAASKLYVTVSV